MIALMVVCIFAAHPALEVRDIALKIRHYALVSL